MSTTCPITDEEAARAKKYVEDYDGRLSIRVVMFGQDGVGKSNIITRVRNVDLFHIGNVH